MAVEPAPADHGVLDPGKRLVDVVAPLVPQPKTTRSLLPTERALCHPPVAPQLLAALDAPAGQARHDPTFSEALAQLLVVVSLVRVQLVGPAARTAPLAPHRRDRVHRRQQPLAIRDICPREHSGKREAVPIYRLVALGARPAPVHR